MTTAKGWLGIMQQAANYNHAMTPLIIKYGEMLIRERDEIIKAQDELIIIRQQIKTCREDHFGQGWTIKMKLEKSEDKLIKKIEQLKQQLK